MNDDYLHSSLREKVLEHVFLGECLRVLWSQGGRNIDVLRPDVDAGGFDIAIECRGVLRHIQLKSSANGSKTRRQTVNARLCAKPSGCVVWIGFDPLTMRLGPFGWFGGPPGAPLGSLDPFPKARHTKANSQGVKGERANSHTVPASRFETLPDIETLVDRLFGPPSQAP